MVVCHICRLVQENILTISVFYYIHNENIITGKLAISQLIDVIMYIYIYVCICICIYIYIHTYTYALVRSYFSIIYSP